MEGGHIIVRTAREGETIQTLDGNQRKLTPSMLCICDENKPVCVAGVMGGANSEIVGDTAMVLFESANFNGTSVHRTAAALGMRTDASARYEKGLDPMNTLKAVERACELVELLGAGEVVDGVMDVIAKDSNPVTVKLEPEKVNGLLGTDVSREEMVPDPGSSGLHRWRATPSMFPPGGPTWSTTPTSPRRWPGSTATTTSPTPSSNGLTARGGSHRDPADGKPAGQRVPRRRVRRDHHLLLHQPHLL